MSTPSGRVQEPPLRLGGHVVLDFLNTVSVAGGELVDSLQSHDDVAQWLAQSKLGPAPPRANIPALLRSARSLRETIRSAIEHIKAGRPPELTEINRVLAKSSSHLELIKLRGGAVRAERKWQSRTAEQILGPLATAAGELLATADFALVRKCENPQCVLWFYDHTKSHHRRWCSTATCGNRNKVAAFRQRRQAER